MALQKKIRNWNNRNNGPAKRIAKQNGAGRKALAIVRNKRARRTKR